jgi:flagellar motility protein MotE (MotC chaperone)
MSKLASNPALVAILGILAGSAVGLGWFWRAASLMVQQAVEARPAPLVAEGKEHGWDFWTIEIDGLAAELKEEKARLRAQADGLNQRSARLDAEQAELAKVRAEIESMRTEINRKVIEITADELKNLKALSQTYSSLSPRAAVAIFKEMDDTTAVKILSLMKSDIVGPIFEEMARTQGPDGPLAKRAAILSEKLRLMKANKPAV